MTRFHQRPLVFAICTALALAIASPIAVAQQQNNDKPLSAREKRAQRNAELGRGKAEQAQEAAPLYPNATRTSPDAKANPKVIKQLQAMQEAYEKDDFAGVLAKADEIAANSAACSGRIHTSFLTSPCSRMRSRNARTCCVEERCRRGFMQRTYCIT